MTAAEALEQRVKTLEAEMRLQRSRSHEYGNKLTEHNGQIEDAREDIHDLKAEMRERFQETNQKVDERFDSLTGQAWRIAGFIVGAMGVAVALISVVIR